MALIRQYEDARHLGVATQKSTGTVFEQSEIPQRHWCGPNMSVTHVLLKIDTYVAGGVSISAKELGYFSIWQVEQGIALSPYLECVSDTNQFLPYGVTVDCTDKCNIKLKLWTANTAGVVSEVPTARVVDREFWLEVYGTR